MPVKPIPDGYPRVVPYLIVKDVPRLIDFLSSVFSATDVRRHDDPDGNVMHAEARIGDSMIMMAEANERVPPIPAALHMYVPDVDQAYKRAMDAGASSQREPTNEFYGDRNASVKDKTGNTWFISTHIEDVSDEEMARRMEEALAARKG